MKKTKNELFKISADTDNHVYLVSYNILLKKHQFVFYSIKVIYICVIVNLILTIQKRSKKNEKNQF